MALEAVTCLPEAQPLAYVSASSAGGLGACLLRIAFHSDPDMRAAVPSSPAARLGTAAHRVLEAAGRGRLGAAASAGFASAFDAAWNGSIGEQWRRSQGNDLEAGWRRPGDWPGFSMTKARTRRLAARVAPKSGTAAKAPGGSAPRVLEEHAQSACGGTLRGRADVVRRFPDHVIQDYKTGSIHGADGSLRSGYRTQLLLYAYLEHEECGSWPVRAEVIPLRGDPAIIEVVPPEATAAAEQALAARDRYNALVGSGITESDAAPSAAACRWCEFELRCPAFWKAASADWTADGVVAVVGTVTAKETFGFGTLDLDLAVSAGTLSEGHCRLHGLPLSQFGTLSKCDAGAVVAACGLTTTESAAVFRSTPWTRAAAAEQF